MSITDLAFELARKRRMLLGASLRVSKTKMPCYAGIRRIIRKIKWLLSVARKE